MGKIGILGGKIISRQMYQSKLTFAPFFKKFKNYQIDPIIHMRKISKMMAYPKVLQVTTSQISYYNNSILYYKDKIL
jgi:hypothetical protein